MASGDAQRVWFPEMLEDLESTWTPSMTWEELADFCRLMTEKRKDILESRGIQPPQTRCPKCGSVSRADISGVSIRSALFALKKSGIVSEADFIEYGGPLAPRESRETLVECGKRPGRKQCLGLLWVTKTEEDAIFAYCPICREDKVMIHWQETLWATA